MGWYFLVLLFFVSHLPLLPTRLDRVRGGCPSAEAIEVKYVSFWASLEHRRGWFFPGGKTASVVHRERNFNLKTRCRLGVFFT